MKGNNMSIFLIIIVGAIATGACVWYAKRISQDISSEQSIMNMLNKTNAEIAKLPTAEEIKVINAETTDRVKDLAMKQSTLEEKILKEVGQKTSMMVSEVNALRTEVAALRSRQRLMDSRLGAIPKVFEVRIAETVPVEVVKRPRKLLYNKPAVAKSLLEEAGITDETKP